MVTKINGGTLAFPILSFLSESFLLLQLEVTAA